MEFDPAPWPMGKSPPSTQVILGEVVPEPEPDELEPPIVPLAERARPKQLSIYGQAMARLRGELPVAADDEERARALNERLRQERLQRRRLQGPPKCFFD